MKNSNVKLKIMEKSCIHKIMTDLNTRYNECKSESEKSMVQIIRNLVMSKGENIDECDSCDDAFVGRNYNKKPNTNACNPSGKTQKSTIHNHDCELCENIFEENKKFKEHSQSLHGDCQQCGDNFVDKSDLSKHPGLAHEEETAGYCQQCGDNFVYESAHEEETAGIFMVHHEEENDDGEFEMNPAIWNVLLSENVEGALTEEEKKEIFKLHRYFAHRSGQKLWENLFLPAGTFKGKKKLVLDFLANCKVCRKFRKTPPRPKVGLPKARDANEVISMDLKIFKKDGKKKKEIGILYLHDEFTKLIKGLVINDKNQDTIVKGIEKKWIVGDGAGPGHPSKGFFSDNGGEFLNDNLIDFASALNITIRMTAAASPWMNGSCERAHATVDRLVEKILEENPKTDLQKAVDLACFTKNTEINQTGYSPLQLLTGRAPSFPGLSDCSPANIDMDDSNEYMRILKRIDHARVEARKIDCCQRLKTALKSKINPSLEQSYYLGQHVWFKVLSSHKWKAGIVLGQDGKIIFLKYGNFMRRVPLDHIIPANECHDDDVNETVSPDDVENADRLADDDFENMEVIAKKDKEIDTLKKINAEQENKIKQMEDLAKQPHPVLESSEAKLPNLHQRIQFQEAGKKKSITGRVKQK